MTALTFVTSNKGKVKESQEILGFPIKIADIELDEIQSMSLKEIVEKKAHEAYSQIKKPLIVDDAGLFIEAWNGFPGPFIKYMWNAGGSDLILRLMDKEENRKVVVSAAIGFHDGKKVHTFVGEINAELARHSRGTDGWGFDPIVVPDGLNKTFSEMGEEEKNNISHRKAVLKKFKEFLKEKNYQFE